MSQPLYRIGVLSQLTGLSTHAIRVWEKRYGASSPHRSPGGARLYTQEDVARFQLIQRLLEQGYATRAIANLSLEKLRELASSRPTEGASTAAPSVTAKSERDEEQASTVRSLVDALAELKIDAAERTLARASNEYSPRDLVMQVLAPTLKEVGRRWQGGELCTASEHAASALLRTRLGALLASQPPGSGAPVVCTTPAGEQHELGALLVAILTAMHGRRVVYLGANLPAEQIAEAVKMSRAKAVALSVVAMTGSAAAKELSRIAAALPREVEVVVGGGGAKPGLRVPKNVHILGSLEELEHWLDSAERRLKP